MRRTALAVLVGALATAGSILPVMSATPAGAATKWATATSASQGGGMSALVKAAKAEGTLNVITLPDTWANYGNIMKDFTKKYGIKIVSTNPTGTSAEEITAVTQLKGQSRAPDVLDLGTSFAITAAKKGLLAPYKVAEWSDIPGVAKTAKGDWFDDYGGYVAIGYNANVVKNPPTSFKDLLKPTYKGQVALNGSPTTAGAAFAAVYAASLANGGSYSNIKPGIEYFNKLNAAGNFVPVTGGPSTVESGQTPILIWWDYLQASEVAQKFKGWKVVIPTDGHYAAYYSQAINATAPHPAAARLWEEYLYSATGQNLWLQGAARPIELPVMEKNGTATKTALAALPKAPTGPLTFPTAAQLTAAEKVVASTWTAAVGG